jgi:hypothetical protein
MKLVHVILVIVLVLAVVTILNSLSIMQVKSALGKLDAATQTKQSHTPR